MKSTDLRPIPSDGSNADNRRFGVGGAIVPVRTNTPCRSMITVVVELGDIERTIGAHGCQVAVGTAARSNIDYRGHAQIAGP